MYTLHTDHINYVIEIRKGFSVDYTPGQIYTDYNNNGQWGRITNRGEVVDSMTYDVNVWKGENCYTSVLREMRIRFNELNNCLIS